MSRQRATTESVLEVSDLSVSYRMEESPDVQAVRGVSFDIEQGRTFGIVGESGCGKTTAANARSKLLDDDGEITDGTVKLNGRDLTALSDSEIRSVRWSEIAVIPQNVMNSLNPVTNVGDQILDDEPFRLLPVLVTKFSTCERRVSVEDVRRVLTLDPFVEHVEKRLDGRQHPLCASVVITQVHGSTDRTSRYNSSHTTLGKRLDEYRHRVSARRSPFVRYRPTVRQDGSATRRDRPGGTRRATPRREADHRPVDSETR